MSIAQQTQITVNSNPTHYPQFANGLRADAAISGKARPGFVDTEQGEFNSNTFYTVIGSRKAISKTAEVVTSILTESLISTQRRGLILALIGESGGSSEPFKLCNFQLGKLLYKFDELASIEEQKARRISLERMVRREIKKLTEEQTASGITLVHVKEGKQIQNGDETLNIPNEFTLLILPLIQNTLAEFKFQKGGDRMRSAARVAIEKAGASLKVAPKTSTRREPDQVTIAHKQALTWAAKYAALRGDKWTAFDELIEEIKALRQGGGEDSRVRRVGCDSSGIDGHAGQLPEQKYSPLFLRITGGGLHF